ncbi:MAG: hypothetical protein JWR09_5891 [Mucilaginibacter sp.]|nr:hypothetical protein [Mucilaginibacter sp.]
MVKALLLIAALASTASRAQTLEPRECNAANIGSTAEAIAKMKDGKQTIASTEIGAASEALAQGKPDDCKDHLMKAILQTK